MKIIVAPDSFKGTLTAAQACEIIARAFASVYPEAEIHTVPLADGGEGMARAWAAACGGELLRAEVAGPYGEPVWAEYLLLPDGTAVLETASCAGLELARPQGLNPERTTTRGLGALMKAARMAGASRILLGLGGSATNDAGCGMAHALGWEFYDSAGASFCPVGGTLSQIARIEPPGKPFALPVTAACDVQAPLFGPGGAAAIYAPQKGADPAMVQRLDQGLRHVASLRAPALANMPGAGAAGGLGFGVLAFLNGNLCPGVGLLLDSAGFDALLEGADLVVTGEGRMDTQTLQGKAPCGVLRRAMARGVPVLGICGCVGQGREELLEAGFAGLFPAVEGARPIEELRRTCREHLLNAARRAACQSNCLDFQQRNQ
ncbi:MAG: glycerate kinase [Oscillospiraceae bacterium]|jgi:glycerate kinase|nr:glycerate kinase [Oscillospiraceae bacterium]